MVTRVDGGVLNRYSLFIARTGHRLPQVGFSSAATGAPR